jgi:hypothetical protein
MIVLPKKIKVMIESLLFSFIYCIILTGDEFIKMLKFNFKSKVIVKLGEYLNHK